MRYKLPKVGQTRFKRRFAFLPKHTDDGFFVWLEIYYQEQDWYGDTWNNSRIFAELSSDSCAITKGTQDD